MFLQTVPGSPKNLMLNPVSPTTLVFTWEEPDTSNGILEGYQLQLTSLQPREVLRAVNVSAQVHQYTWTGLHPYYYYEVTVAALTSAGKGRHTLLRVQMSEARKSYKTILL